MSWTGGKSGKLSAEDLVYLNEEIAAMAKAGLPLEEGLKSIAREMSWGGLRTATEEIHRDLVSGKTLPEAMAAQKGKIPDFYADLVHAGIQGGSLPEVLSTLTTYARSLADLRSVVVTALFYPVIVLGIAIALFSMILFFVMPQFASIFRDFNMSLPGVTRFVLGLAHSPFYYLVVPFLVAIGGVLSLRWVLRSSDSGRRVWTRITYAVPVFGSLVRSARLAAFTDLLGILIEQELPLPQALRLAGDAGSDPILREGARSVADRLEKGDALNLALKEGHVLPDIVIWMAGIGEMNGKLAVSLRQASLMYRRQVEMRASLAQSIIPPFLIVVLAAIITSVFVLAVFMPLIKLLEGLSK